MTLQMYLIPIMIMSFCIRITLECSQRNTSCNDIKTANGFKFLYGCPEESEISVHDNKTSIAHAKLGNQTLNDLKVMSMDNHSVITRDCRDLQVQCIVPNGKSYVKEICVEYKITEKMKNPDPNDLPTQWDLIIGVPLGVIVLTGIIGMLCWGYISWKKELKKGRSQAEKGETEETRHHEGSEVQEVTADDLETPHNATSVIRLSEILSATDPHGSGENDIEQDNTLGSVHVHSIDPKADGKTPQSLSLDRNLSNEGIQQSKNGDISAADVNRASNHRAMNSNVRDDPGGVNDNKGKDIVREMHNGWTLGDRGPEDHENEGQPLLSSQRAAIQGFDMTGEAVALVNKRGFDPDQVSRCSTAQDTDVESTHKN